MTKVLQLSLEPESIYLIRDPERPYTNPKLDLNMISREVTVPVLTSRLSNSSANAGGGQARIFMTCNWDDPTESLCTRQEAAAAVVKPQYGTPWTAGWEGDYWQFDFAGATLPDPFYANFSLENLQSSVAPGAGALYLMAEGIPGFAPEAVFVVTVQKRYPVAVECSVKPEIVMAGDRTELAWHAVNASKCFMNGVEVDVRATVPVTVREKTEYHFLAQNSAGALGSGKTMVDVTNWRSPGTLKPEKLPLDKPAGVCARRLLYREGKLYALMDGHIYFSADGGGEWNRLSERPCPGTAGDCDCTTNLHDGSLHVLGAGGVDSFNLETRAWTSRSAELSCSPRRNCAVSYPESPLYISPLSDTTLGFFERDRTFGSWSLRSYWQFDPEHDRVSRIEAVDAVAHGNGVCLSVRDGPTGLIQIFEMNGYADCVRLAGAQGGAGWHRLVVVADTLLLITSTRVVCPLHPLVEFRNFLPELAEDYERAPWIGGAEERLVLLNQRDGRRWEFVPWKERGRDVADKPNV